MNIAGEASGAGIAKERFINSVNLNSNTDFPYLVLEVVNDHSYPRNPGFQVMHWHDDLQLIYVLEGTAEVRTLDSVVRIQAEEGLLINKGVVHYVGRVGSCRYNSFLFPAFFLGFYTGSPAKAMVDCVVADEHLPFVHFTPAVGWHKDILSLLERLAEIEKQKTEFYVYEVLVLLSSLWLVLRKNMGALPVKKESAVNSRMQKILCYMEDHYAEDITLADLSSSANISKSECSRCFKLSLNTTPYKYLTEYRLSKAAQLLETTNEPVGNIAIAVGFHQMSHFGKCFKDKTGYSPKMYRKVKSRS